MGKCLRILLGKIKLRSGQVGPNTDKQAKGKAKRGQPNWGRWLSTVKDFGEFATEHYFTSGTSSKRILWSSKDFLGFWWKWEYVWSGRVMMTTPLMRDYKKGSGENCGVGWKNLGREISRAKHWETQGSREGNQKGILVVRFCWDKTKWSLGPNQWDWDIAHIQINWGPNTTTWRVFNGHNTYIHIYIHIYIYIYIYIYIHYV